MFVENGYSGLFTTRRGGNKLSSVWMNGVMKLNPDDNVDNQNTWIGLYRIIARANAAIDNSTIDPDSTDPNQIRINDVIGHAYFSRSYAYFQSQDYGVVFSWTNLEADNIAWQKYSKVYKLIERRYISKSLLNGSAGVGFKKHMQQDATSKGLLLLATNSIRMMIYQQMIIGFGIY